MLFLISSLAQVAKHQMMVLSRFGVQYLYNFKLNVNKVYISQATFSWRLLRTSNIVSKNVTPCDFCPPTAATTWRRPLEQHTNIYVARTSNSIVISSGDPHCFLLPQCETLRTCGWNFPIATQETHVFLFSPQTCPISLNTFRWLKSGVQLISRIAN